MSKLNNCYWGQTDNFFDCTVKHTEEVSRGTLQLYSKIFNHHREPLLQPNRDGKVFRRRILSVKNRQLRKPISYLDSIITFREGLNMNTEIQDPTLNNDESTFFQKSMFSLFAFESATINFFPTLIVWNSYGTVDYDGLIKLKMDVFMNLFFKWITRKELSTINHNCELEGTQLLTISARSVQTFWLHFKSKSQSFHQCRSLHCLAVWLSSSYFTSVWSW